VPGHDACFGQHKPTCADTDETDTGAPGAANIFQGVITHIQTMGQLPTRHDQKIKTTWIGKFGLDLHGQSAA
jgi:hypothetical protein